MLIPEGGQRAHEERAPGTGVAAAFDSACAKALNVKPYITRALLSSQINTTAGSGGLTHKLLLHRLATFLAVTYPIAPHATSPAPK